MLTFFFPTPLVNSQSFGSIDAITFSITSLTTTHSQLKGRWGHFFILGVIEQALRCCYPVTVFFTTWGQSYLPRTTFNLTPGTSFKRPTRTNTMLCSCKLCPSPGTWAIISFPVLNFTKTHLRLAEFGFLGFFIKVFRTTPLANGLPSRGLGFFRFFLRGPRRCKRYKWAMGQRFRDDFSEWETDRDETTVFKTIRSLLRINCCTIGVNNGFLKFLVPLASDKDLTDVVTKLLIAELVIWQPLENDVLMSPYKQPLNILPPQLEIPLRADIKECHMKFKKKGWKLSSVKFIR